MTRNVKAEFAENTHYKAVCVTYYLKLEIIEIYILENTGMDMCPNCLTSKAIGRKYFPRI
jgi:hypothetical protein